MNTARKLVVVAAVFALAGCASSGGTAMHHPAESKIDTAYVAAVEHAASKAPVRVRVVWVNPPEKRETAR